MPYMRSRSIAFVLLFFSGTAAALAAGSATAALYRMSSADFRQYAPAQARIGETLDPDLLGAAIFHATNEMRRKMNLTPFAYSEALEKIARQHSSEMADKQYFAHDSPVAKYHTLKDRVRLAGLKYGTFAENIAVRPVYEMGSGKYYVKQTAGGKSYREDVKTGQVLRPATYLEWADAVLNAWMHSPEHRANLVNPKLTELGVGVARGPYDGQDAIYATQDFAHPVK